MYHYFDKARCFQWLHTIKLTRLNVSTKVKEEEQCKLVNMDINSIALKYPKNQSTKKRFCKVTLCKHNFCSEKIPWPTLKHPKRLW